MSKTVSKPKKVIKKPVKKVVKKPMKRKKAEVPRIVCEDCGKSATKDNLRSNENWEVFDMKTPCPECGGKYVVVKAKITNRRKSVMAQKAAKMLVETGGTKTKGEILKEVGYSDAMAKNPQKVFDSKSASEIIDPYLASLVEHRDEVIREMRAKTEKAGYGDLVRGLKEMNYQIRLLTGKSTSNVAHLHAQRAEEIDALLELE